MRLRLIFGLAAVCVLMAICTVNASAMTVEMVNCDAAQGVPNLAWTTFGIGSTADDCAIGGGLSIGSTGPAPGGETGWAIDVGPGERILSGSVEVSGNTGPGMSYAIAGCLGCSPLAIIDSRTADDPPATVSIPQVELSALYVYASCELPDSPYGCSDESLQPFSISNIRLTLGDVAPPTATFVSVNGGPVPGDGFVGWTNKPIVPVALSFADDGFGVTGGSVSIDDAFPELSWDYFSACGFPPLTSPTICKPQQDAGGYLSFAGLVDGMHELRATATDAAMQSGSSNLVSIGIDRLPPQPPAGLKFSPELDGQWVSNPTVQVSWADAPELDDSSTESPIVAAQVTVREAGNLSATRQTVSLPTTSSAPIVLTSDGTWWITVSWVDAAGNVGDPAVLTVGYDGDLPSPPDLSSDGWINQEDLLAGHIVNWQPPIDDVNVESGICRYAVSIDRSPTGMPDTVHGESTVRPSWRLPGNLPDGANQLHVASISCAGKASAVATVELLVDATAPDMNLSGMPRDGEWSRSPVAARFSASDGGSGIESVSVSLDGAPMSVFQADSASVAVPEGVHTVRAYADDQAGNRSGVNERIVRTDLTAPDSEFETSAVSNPRRVVVHVADALSGLASAALQYRRTDPAATVEEGAWHTLDGPAEIGPDPTKPVTIVRDIPDDKLPAGSYELRVLAVDLAGNASTGGATRSIVLPIRRAPMLSASIARYVKRCRAKRRPDCRSARTCTTKRRCQIVTVLDTAHARVRDIATFGTPSALVGEAFDELGRPVAGATIRITETVAGHPAKSLGTAITSDRGRYRFRLPAGPTRTLTVKLDETPASRSANATAVLGARPRIEFQLTPRRLIAGRRLLLSGRVQHAAWLPAGGVAVYLQFLSTDGWQYTWRKTQTDDHGRFSFSKPWPAASQSSTVMFRAAVDSAVDWPFVAGHSAARRVRVIPAH